ncbi:SET domain [Phytophthora cactorum]|nr:SET domain [Phytophthora cactorum]
MPIKRRFVRKIPVALAPDVAIALQPSWTQFASYYEDGLWSICFEKHCERKRRRSLLGIVETHVETKAEGKPSGRGRKRNPKPTSKAAYINAESCGGIARFVNHSCNANCQFEERKYVVKNRDGVERVIATMVIVAEYAIREETELTVDYGKDLWFKCRCNHDNCRNPA